MFGRPPSTGVQETEAVAAASASQVPFALERIAHRHYIVGVHLMHSPMNLAARRAILTRAYTTTYQLLQVPSSPLRQLIEPPRVRGEKVVASACAAERL